MLMSTGYQDDHLNSAGPMSFAQLDVDGPQPLSLISYCGHADSIQRDDKFIKQRELKNASNGSFDGYAMTDLD